MMLDTTGGKVLSNIEKHRDELKKLVDKGDMLFNAIQYECMPEAFEKAFGKLGGKNSAKAFSEFKEKLPSFCADYQEWYSESQSVIKQLLPDRLFDFVKFYEKPRTRKEITYDNYSIEDYLHGLRVTRGGGSVKIVGPEAAIPRYKQQLSILKAAEKRFDSRLFDIAQLVRADLFDSELDASRELLAKKFTRAAGAITGVVLEKHLSHVCENHKIVVKKKDPSINDLNNLLKDNEVVDIPQWRFIQHLADIRNLCDHDKKKEPTIVNVDDLITGVYKVTKTIY